MAEQKDAAINMMGQSLFSGDAYNQRQQNFNMASQALQMQAQRQQANNELSGAVRDNYEQTVATANAAAVRPYDKKRLDTILGGGYERVIEDIKNNYNGDFMTYSNSIDASGVSGADKIRNIFFNDDLQGLYQELNHNKKQFSKIIDLQKNNKSHLIPKAYSLALEEWQQDGPTDSKPTLSRLPTFYELKDPSTALEEKFASIGGNYGASPEDILEVASKEISHNMSLEGYNKDEMEMINRDLALGRGPGYDAAIEFVKNNHVTSGMVNPQSPDYISGNLQYGKGDIIVQVADELNKESYKIYSNEDYKSIVKGVNTISDGYVKQLQTISSARQTKLPYENLGPLRGKGKRIVTGGVLYDNSADMKNILESALPGYEAEMGSEFGLNNGQLVLDNYNFLKHGNVYHADSGTLLGGNEVFDAVDGLTTAVGFGLAGAGVGSVTGPGAVFTGAGGFVAGALTYASTTELDAFKDFTIDKIVLGYKVNMGNGEYELMLDFEDKGDGDFKEYMKKFDFDGSDSLAGTVEPVHLAYGRDQDLTFSDGYLIELNFNDSAVEKIKTAYSAERGEFDRVIKEGIQGSKGYNYSIEAQKLKADRTVANVQKAQTFVNNMFGDNPETVNNIQNTFGQPLQFYAKSVNIPEIKGKENQSLLLAEILVSSQYFKDANGKYSKISDDKGTKIAQDAFNKIQGIGGMMSQNKAKLSMYQSMKTQDILKGFTSFYSDDMIKDMKQLTIALRDLKGL